jgi:O-antigen ligase
LFGVGLSLSNVRGGGGHGTIGGMSDRFISIFTGSKLYKSDSLEWRRVENKYALQQIVKHPFLGIGLGKDYRPQIFGSYDTSTGYIHNGYLGILLDVGLIGLLPLLWFFVRFVIRGFRNWDKIKDTYMNLLLTGFTLSVLGVLLINMVSPVFRQWFSIVVFPTIIGLSEVIIRINEMELHKRNE